MGGGTVTHGGVTVTYDAATDTVTFGGIIYDVISPEGMVARFELAKDAV